MFQKHGTLDKFRHCEFVVWKEGGHEVEEVVVVFVVFDSNERSFRKYGFDRWGKFALGRPVFMGHGRLELFKGDFYSWMEACLETIRDSSV